MSKHAKPDKPWTFELFEIWATPTWEIYDPNLARVVAVFYDEAEAEDYLSRVNFKQADKAAKKARKAAAKAARLKEEEDELW